MTDDDGLSPAERAARTKRLRTKLKLVDAAAFWVREVGIDARAEDIAEDAGVSVATYYNVFPSRGKLFDTLFSTQCYEPTQHGVFTPNRLADVATTQQSYFTPVSATIRKNLNVVRGVLSTRYDHVTDGRMTVTNAFVQNIMIVSGAWLEERGWNDNDRNRVRAATLAGFIGALDYAVHGLHGFDLADLLSFPPANAMKFAPLLP